MRLLNIFSVLFLAGLVCAAPTSKNDDKVIVTEEFFPDALAIYTAEHDIVNIVVPLNALNFEEDTDSDEVGEEIVIFFVEADIHKAGDRTDRGLYALKGGKATKLLENGRDATAANDDTKEVYFGASHGLYKYNHVENKAEKYGTLTDSIVSLVKENGTDVIYILTDNHEVYKVTDEGTKKVKVDAITYASQIVLDFSNNLYFVGSDGFPYVITSDGAKKIEGLPGNHTYVKLLKPPFVIEDGVPFIANDQSYTIYANGSSELDEFVLQVKPTAYSMEATLIQYYAYNKKIYEYNILTLILGSILEQLKDFLEDKKDSIQSIATRSRNDLRP